MTTLRTTVGELALEEYDLQLGDRTWRILHNGAIISHDDEKKFLAPEQAATRVPYGLVLWPSSIALAHDVAARPMEGARVLELGAGTGLPGIVAAALGARVVQTDRQEVALHLSKMNAERNGVTKNIEHRVADWREWNDRERYDYVIGSDIIYAESMHRFLRPIFESNLAPGGTVLMSDPFRHDSFVLLEAMEADGWRVRFDKWTVGVVPPPRPVGVFELRPPSRTGEPLLRPSTKE